MVLAAGLGTRMRPITLTRPKPLVEVAGKTLLDHTLDRVSEAGIASVVVNTHYLASMVADHVADRSDLSVTVSHEPDLLETGGGVRKALPLLGSGPFLVANADILWFDGERPTVARLRDGWDGDVMDALLLVVPIERAVGYSGRGDFHLDAAGRLARRCPDGTAPYVFAGVHLVNPELFTGTPDGPFSANLVWDRALRAGRLHGIVHDGPWYHVGTPDAVGDTESRIAASRR
jgi:N-acetyl-alpha-D-muramate 1-phosphate uridylyltransferase